MMKEILMKKMLTKKAIPFVFLLFPVLLAILFSGCMSVETTVELNRDGSGRIIEKIGLGMAMANLATQMSGGGAGDESAAQAPSPFNGEQLENTAKDFGEGVKFVSMSESEDANMKYYEAVYSFEDINKIGIDQNQGNRASMAGGQGGSGDKEPVRFKFSRNDDDSTLEIMLPETKDEVFAESSPTPQDSPPDMNMGEAGGQMMKMMLKGMRFAVKIEFNGEIVETDATNVDGNTVTLLEMDFEKIIDDAEKLQELSTRQPSGIQELQEILGGIEGLKFETREKVTIRFE
jgi:hypothetical protein